MAALCRRGLEKSAFPVFPFPNKANNGVHSLSVVLGQPIEITLKFKLARFLHYLSSGLIILKLED